MAIALNTQVENSTPTAGTSHVLSLPASPNAGDYYLILLDKGSTAATFAQSAGVSGWTELLDENVANGLFVAYHLCDGTEGASPTVTFTSSAATRSASIAYRITGAGSSPTFNIAGTATAASNTPNPPSVTVVSGTNCLVFPFFGSPGEEADDDTWVTVTPTNYTNLRQKTCGTVGTNLGGLIASAHRNFSPGSSTEDPGTFTMAVSATWRASTVAVIESATAITGTGSPSLGTVALTSAGTVDVAGAASPSLGTVALASAGTVLNTGALSKPLATFTLASAGVVFTSLVGSPSLGTVSLVSTGTVAVAGAASPALATVATASAGTVLVSGVLSKSLATFTLASAGTVLNTGALSQPLAVFTLTSAGTVLNTGALSKSLATVTSTSAGTVLVQGALSQSLFTISLSAAGNVGSLGPITGTGSPSLGTLALSSAGTVLVTGQASPTYTVFALTSTGTVQSLPATGTGTPTLAVFTLLGTAITVGTVQTLPTKRMPRGPYYSSPQQPTSTHYAWPMKDIYGNTILVKKKVVLQVPKQTLLTDVNGAVYELLDTGLIRPT